MGVLLGDADRWAHFTVRCSGPALLTPACRTVPPPALILRMTLALAYPTCPHPV